MNILVKTRMIKNQRNQIISLISGSDFFGTTTNQRNQKIRLINGADK